MGKIRIGHGYDVHRLTEGRKLIIGGVDIPFEKGLLGHSDADVLVHAVMDAVLGAIGMPDIGCLFPDSSPEYSGISSLTLAEKVFEIMERANCGIGNIDCTVIAQKPKLAQYVREMERNIACAFHTDETAVNVKATTEEGLGFTGMGEGIAAHAVCILEEKEKQS